MVSSLWRAIGLPSAAVLLAAAAVAFLPRAALSLPYSFSVDQFSLSGTSLGSFVDDFNDGTLSPWIVAFGTATESGGYAVLADPGSPDATNGSAFERTDIVLPEVTWDGHGDFTATATFATAVPTLNQAYGMHITFESSPGEFLSYWLQIVNLSSAAALTLGATPGLSVALPVTHTVGGIHTATSYPTSPLTVENLSGAPNLMFRAAFNDATDAATFSLSLDGGASYLAPFAPLTLTASGGFFSLIGAVPEPTTAWLIALGLAGIALAARWHPRRRHRMRPVPRVSRQLLALICLALLGGPASAISIGLQNGTATFSQSFSGSWSPDEAIDGLVVPGGINGWAIFDLDTDQTVSQTAIWETVSDANASQLDFTLSQVDANESHLIGRFRLSITSDDRSTFADGADNLGDVTANWTVLSSPTVSGPAGMTFTTLGDSSVLVSGVPPATGVYSVQYVGNYFGITGIRLEVLEDSSLPGDGPGLFSNGNFVLTEIQLDASGTPVPEASTALLCGLGVAWLAVRHRLRA